MHKPKLIKQMEYQLDKEDFICKEAHKILFICIYNLAQQGVESINLADVDNYLAANSPIDYTKLFEKNNGEEWITQIMEDANIGNFDYYYNGVRKLSLLRSYLKEGISVESILDLNEIDEDVLKIQRTQFDKMSIEDILTHFDRMNLRSKQRFTAVTRGKSRKAGDNAEELYEMLKVKPSYGYGLESEYLNTITYGILPGRYLLCTRDTSCGKTRSALKRLVNLCSPYRWDFKSKEFVPNPNGQHNSGLYIGTEMDVFIEIEPILWCFIAGVESNKFMEGRITEEEDDRIKQAIQYCKQMELYLEEAEEYDVNYLWQTTEHYVLEKDIKMVCLDYIEPNSGLTREYASMNKGIGGKDDIAILNNLSANIKAIAKRFDIFFIAYTQTNDEGRSLEKRDQTAIKGSKALPNKADFGLTVFEPTTKELEMLTPIIEKKSVGLNNDATPNICYTIYKNRWYKVKKLKIWAKQDLGTGEVRDCFCTDERYNIIDIPKTKINIEE